MRRPTVSVNIAVKDRRELMGACLDGLANQTHKDFDVVVVDNGSTDGTREMLAARAADPNTPYVLTIVDSDGSLGAVRNAGVAASSGEVVAFVDSDCVPTPTWLERGLAQFDTPEVTTVQGATLPDPSIERGSWDATQELTRFTNRYEACNLFYKRAVLLEAGGFDEKIGFFGEDSMAGWAVRRLGGEERFAPDALVHHTVTFPGVRWHWRRGFSYSHWNMLVRRFPEMREGFYMRFFLRQETAQTFFALYGLGVFIYGLGWSTWWVSLAGFVAMSPMLWRNRPRRLTRWAIRDFVGAMGFDVAVELGLLWGSIRERTLVL